MNNNKNYYCTESCKLASDSVINNWGEPETDWSSGGGVCVYIYGRMSYFKYAYTQ